MDSSIFSKKLVPVAIIENSKDAVPLAEALIAGGLNVIEVTLRTESALESISLIKKEVPEMNVGAGTILDAEVVPQLVDAGVSFGISPGINPDVLEAAAKLNFPFIPGVISPSEIEQARKFDLQTLKFFPAEAAGGAKMLKALAAPYAHKGIKFVPTGGIGINSLEDYLKIPAVTAVGGSWFVAPKLINEAKFDEISKLTQEAIAKVEELGVRS